MIITYIHLIDVTQYSRYVPIYDSCSSLIPNNKNYTNKRTQYEQIYDILPITNDIKFKWNMNDKIKFKI